MKAKHLNCLNHLQKIQESLHSAAKQFHWDNDPRCGKGESCWVTKFKKKTRNAVLGSQKSAQLPFSYSLNFRLLPRRRIRRLTSHAPRLRATISSDVSEAIEATD